jgi:hypothetical protein
MMGTVTVNDGRSVIPLNHDRAGPGVLVIRLTATCDTRGATEVSSDQPQVRRYQRIDRQTPRLEATRFDRFPGGCVTARSAVPAANQAEVTGQLATPAGRPSNRRWMSARMGDCDSTHRLLDEGRIRGWQGRRMFWSSSMLRGGPRSARCMDRSGSAAECG